MPQSLLGRRQAAASLLVRRLMGIRFDIDVLAIWMDAILDRMETEHPETNWNLLALLGEMMSLPLWLGADNDNQPDR